MTDHRNDSSWIQVYSGNKFYPLDPRPEDFLVEDIAHALSNMCRFAGHVDTFYSVAQHCVLVSRICDQAYALEGLLHDATEAYLVDIPKPIKESSYLAGYKDLEATMEEAVATRFNLTWPWPKSVKDADVTALMTERRDLMAKPPIPWGNENWPKLDFTIVPLVPKEAKNLFLNRYTELTGEREWTY